MCDKLATWYVVDGPGHDNYTLACDKHVGLLRSATTEAAYVITEEYPCCFIDVGQEVTYVDTTDE